MSLSPWRSSLAVSCLALLVLNLQSIINLSVHIEALDMHRKTPTMDFLVACHMDLQTSNCPPPKCGARSRAGGAQVQRAGLYAPGGQNTLSPRQGPRLSSGKLVQRASYRWISDRIRTVQDDENPTLSSSTPERSVGA